MSRILRSIGIGFAAFMATCPFLQAQTSATAQISGIASDTSGAILPGVDIRVTQTDTGITRAAVTNETGAYVLPNLAVGPYRLEASLPGFRSFVQTGIVLQVGSNPVINVSLQVGQVAETVEVQANATFVETRVTGVGTVIENQRILELPLNGRQATDLITLAGAAVQTGQSPAWAMKTGVNIAVAGGQS
jgi:Carboxypeptidase regulatory-like domain